VRAVFVRTDEELFKSQNMLNATTQKKDQGFSLIELMIAVAVIMILAAIAVPRLLNTVSDVGLRYSATNFSGLLQSARIQAVRKNTFYTIQQATLPSGDPGYYIDIPKNGAYITGDPVLPLNAQLTIHPGIGSGAPNEGTFIAGLNFTVNPGGSPPSFNARGLPCVAAANSCPQTPGQGFVLFLSKPALTGNVNWASIVINPSGRVQIWTCDDLGNWIQRN
jgi:prepilin-type N-terminal cleavage/methylation domain-containing protein